MVFRIAPLRARRLAIWDRFREASILFIMIGLVFGLGCGGNDVRRRPEIIGGKASEGWLVGT
jgi:F0F1-type ATP synthase assembly protein I